ncbi:MAG: pyridoxamine 5'-phosphate oxidase family protein [Clostridiales Family XIII bacterium]|nr:pyridoxamine 5'-phosphate oxidase family protein [Clostridiales Family XIII bacterium]
MNEVIQFIKKAAVFFIATVDDGAPRVRPFGAVMEFEGNLYLCMNNQKKVYRQLKQNNRIELCAYDGAGNWLRVSALVTFDERQEAREAMLVECPNLRDMYSADDGLYEVCYLKDAIATFYSFTGEPRVVAFG